MTHYMYIGIIMYYYVIDYTSKLAYFRKENELVVVLNIIC